MTNHRILLNESEMPKKWYNLQADLPVKMSPPLHPGTGQPIGPKDMSHIFSDPIIEQEFSDKQWIDIPEEVRDIYGLWRPTPLVRALNLEKYLNTPAHIYFKNESVSPAGSHKTNTAVAQAYYNKQAGIKKLTTETGAGQWGCALSFSTQLFGLKCVIYMVKVSYEQKPYRKSMMQVWGGEVYPSPSNRTDAGRKMLAKDPDSPGTLGDAISEAIEEAIHSENTKYSLGSVANHVLIHQSIIGLEAKKQMEKVDEYPDIIIGCHGGGSNFGGISFPFIHDKITGKKNPRVIAVEAEACPTLTRGKYTFDFGDTIGMTPLYKMYTLGHSFMPAGIDAGGLRYHGAAPLVSAALDQTLIEAKAYFQCACFEAALIFAKTEGIIPAPESSHAIRAAIDEAVRCRETGEKKTILFNLSGHGLIDMLSYDKYIAGELQDYSHPQEEIEKALAELPVK